MRSSKHRKQRLPFVYNCGGFLAVATGQLIKKIRFRNLQKGKITEDLVDRTIEPRLNQIFVPLLSIIEGRQAREDLKELAIEIVSKARCLKNFSDRKQRGLYK